MKNQGKGKQEHLEAGIQPIDDNMLDAVAGGLSLEEFVNYTNNHNDNHNDNHQEERDELARWLNEEFGIEISPNNVKII